MESFEQRPLTPRETEILSLLREGRSGREIAVKLHISIKTVAFHKGHLFRKLGVETSAEAVSRAIRIGIVDP